MATENLRIRISASGGAQVAGEAAKANAGLTGIQQTSAKTGGAVAGVGKSMAKFIGASAGITGVAVAARGTVREFVAFDEQMRNVNSIAHLSERQFKSVSEQVAELAGPTAQAPSVLAAGMYDLVSSGFSAQQSVKLVGVSAKAASAGMTDTATAAKGVAAVLNAYQMPATKAKQVSDALFQTVNLGVITFDELANNIGNVLPYAAKTGISLREVGAVISTMTKQGIGGANAITFMKNAIVAFQNPSENMKDAIKKTGYESGEALLKAKGFEGALRAVGKTTDGSSTALQGLFPNIRASIVALALSGKTARSAAADYRAMQDSAGATNRAFAEQSKSVAFQWRKMRAEAEGFADTLISRVVPRVTSGMETINKTTKKPAVKKGIDLGLSSIPDLLRDIKKNWDGSFGTIKREGASLEKVGRFEIRVSSRRALSEGIGPVKKGLASIPGVRTVRIRILKPNDVVLTKTKTILDKLGQPREIKIKKLRSGDVETIVGKPKKISVDADTGPARRKARAFAESLNGLKPAKPKVDANAEPAKQKIQSVQQLLNSLNGKTANTYVVTHVRKVKGRAMGGRVQPGEALTLVGERGPEIVSLPVGSFVHTAQQSRGIMGGIQAFANGGTVKPPAAIAKKKPRKYGARSRFPDMPPAVAAFDKAWENYTEQKRIYDNFRRGAEQSPVLDGVGEIGQNLTIEEVDALVDRLDTLYNQLTVQVTNAAEDANQKLKAAIEQIDAIIAAIQKAIDKKEAHLRRLKRGKQTSRVKKEIEQTRGQLDKLTDRRTAGRDRRSALLEERREVVGRMTTFNAADSLLQEGADNRFDREQLTLDKAAPKTSATSDNSALADLLRQQLESTSAELALIKAQRPLFVGSFKTGGTVPADGLAYVHKGEEVIPVGKVGGAGVHISINVHGNEALAAALAGAIDVSVDEANHKIGGLAGRQRLTGMVAGRTARYGGGR